MPPQLTARSRRWSRVALALVAVTVSLVLAEVAYRHHLRRAHAARLASFRSDLWQLQPGDCRIYSMTPDRRLDSPGSTGSRWILQTNTQGLRGRALSRAVAGGPRRVLVLGDSFTFGWGVSEKQAFPRQLERLLNGRVQVFNAGVPGYNTEQQACQLHQLWDQAAPHAVLLAYVVNDAEPQHTVPTSPDVVHRHVGSWLAERARQAVNALGDEARPLFRLRYHRHHTDYLRGFAPTSPKWQASKAALGRMAALCRRHGVPLVVLILPDFDEHFDASYRATPIHRQVKAWCKELGLPVHDLLVQRLKGQDHKLFKLAGGHPNANGHAEIAAQAVEALQDLLK